MFTDLQLAVVMPPVFCLDEPDKNSSCYPPVRRICYSDETLSVSSASRCRAPVGTVRHRRSSGYRTRQFRRGSGPGEHPTGQSGHRHSVQNGNRRKRQLYISSTSGSAVTRSPSKPPASPKPRHRHHRQRQRPAARGCDAAGGRRHRIGRSDRRRRGARDRFERARPGDQHAKAIVELPLNGRNYSDLALLTTNVHRSIYAYAVPPREGAFNVNGMRSTYNNFLLDGVDNNAYSTSNQGFSNQVAQPSPDADRRVQSHHQQLQRRVRTRGRRGGQRGHALRHQPVPRHGVRVSAQHRISTRSASSSRRRRC